MTDDPLFTLERSPGRIRLNPRNIRGFLILLAFTLVLVALPLAPMLLGLNPFIGLAIMPLGFLLFIPLICFARSRSVIVEAVDAEELAAFRAWKRETRR